MAYKGLFITLEGGEGSGKTSQIKVIEEYLEKNNIPYISTREPGGIKISEDIRGILLDKKNIKMDERTEALLYCASRRQHLVEKVIPALKEGKVVICDRFIDSSLAYQGYAREIGMDIVYEINKFAIDQYMPSLTLFLDINPEEGLRRVRNRNDEMNRIDLEKLDFHKKVREGYLKLLQQYPNRIKKINAEQSIEDVSKEVINIIDTKIKKHLGKI